LETKIKMKVKLWGVRGSIPTTGPDTEKYGGNTSCASVVYDDHLLVLDGGTGIRDAEVRILPVRG
jgi:phosphoribosyl 1,2-cyclic phosphodiesterase